MVTIILPTDSRIPSHEMHPKKTNKITVEMRVPSLVRLLNDHIDTFPMRRLLRLLTAVITRSLRTSFVLSPDRSHGGRFLTFGA